jgi:SAM-dependent methyltransferase
VERILVRRGLAASVVAFDGSMASLHIAKIAAKEEGVDDRIHYFAADFNKPALPSGRYDLVLFHQSAHHVEKLERLFRAVLRTMQPDGILYLDEYIGPSRSDWTEELFAPHRRFYATLPRALHAVDVLHYPIQGNDPSEAFRSSEIESQLAVGFETLARRPYGGSLLAVIYPNLRRDRLDEATIRMLIAAERQLLDRGMPSYYAVLVLRPRRGLRKIYARAHYFAVPKLKRIGREIRKLLTAKARKRA